MKKILSALFLATVLLVAGCGEDVSSLDGIWLVDVEETLEAAEVSMPDDPLTRLALERLAPALANIQLKIDSKAKQVTLSAAGHETARSFEVVSEKSGTFILKVDEEEVELRRTKKGEKELITLVGLQEEGTLVLARKK